MAKIEINRKEIEKMLKEQFDFKSISWDKEGNATKKTGKIEGKRTQHILVDPGCFQDQHTSMLQRFYRNP